MDDRFKYERLLWFHEEIKAGKYPDAGGLAEKYETSQRTAQRDIDFMQERLNAPLEYDPSKKGYYYSDESYELPQIWFSEDNILALALAVRLASTIPDIETKKKLCDLLEAIFSLQDSDKKLSLENISENISVKNVEYSKVDEKYFHDIVNALFKKTPVTIAYYSPHTTEKTIRTILPLHLLNYMGSWHIIAFCTRRKGIRDFALSRIKSVDRTIEEISPPKDLASIKAYIRKNFGIMQGGETREVCLKFSPSVSEWMHEQIWHPLQKSSFESDNSLLLTFPVADFRELKRRILSHGADVRVIYPQELAEEIKEEICKMGKIY